MTTIICMSDLHNQQTMISCALDEVRIRGTIQPTVQKIRDSESIDIAVLCGDYTSDIAGDLPSNNWHKVRQMQHHAIRKLGGDTDIIYAVGNHDFECAKKMDYHCGDYHTGFMTLTDTFFEMTDDGKHNLLAAYYYQSKGQDFVVLNCGKHYYDNAWCYRHTNSPFSDESVDWVLARVDALRAKNPSKPIFFLCHMPFSDYKGMSNPDKGIDQSLQGTNSTKRLREGLVRHKNILHIYGHDHAKETSFIHSDVAERITVDGGLISVFCGSLRYYDNPIDGWVNERNSKIIQALIIRVDDTQIELEMVNYGVHGEFDGITIKEKPKKYFIAL